MENFLDPEQLKNLATGYVIPWAINITMAIVVFIIGRMVVGFVVRLVNKLMKRSKMDEILVNFICSILNAVLLLFVVVAALDQLGVNTTSLIALMGAAGLAVGLALQNSLQNFAAGVMLIVFRPFKAGDFVEAGGTTGIVENISIFSTMLKTLDNREVIVPNGNIYGSNITNFSARPTRRVDLMFGIGYGDDIRQAKDIMTKLVVEDERILKDPEPQIVVGELGDNSVNFHVRPWVKSADYWDVYFDLTEKVKLAFDEADISIPYPQMDVHMDKAE